MQYASYLLILAIIMWVSDIIGTATKAKIPGVFMLSVFLLVGWWTVLPKDFLDVAQIGIMATFVRHYIMVQIGTLFDAKALKKEWKTVVIAFGALVGLCIMTFGVGQFIIGKDLAIAITPTLAGGGMAAMLTTEAAAKINRTDIATVAILALSLQGFVGMPGAAHFLTKHGNLLLAKYRSEKLSAVTTSGEEFTLEKLAAEELGEGQEVTKKRLIDLIPNKYKSANYYIFSLMFFALISVIIADFCAKIGLGIINTSITGILVGILANVLGLIDKDPQGKGQMAGFGNFVLMPSILGGLRAATPQLVLSLAKPLGIGLLLATIGIVIVSIGLSKIKAINLETNIAIAIGLNCFLGFPPNYFVTVETINALSNDDEEKAYLTSEMMPKMILGSVVTVSIVSVIVAGVMMPMLG